MIDVDTAAGLITVPCHGGSKVRAVIENTRVVVPILDLSEFAMSFTDELDDLLESKIDHYNARKASNIELHASVDQQALHGAELAKVSKHNSNVISNLTGPSVEDRIEVF